jgi:hypothetical protein
MPAPETDSLAQLIDDCRHMPAAMLPRPRTPDGQRVIDLTSSELTIPESAASLVDGYDPVY